MWWSFTPAGGTRPFTRPFVRRERSSVHAAGLVFQMFSCAQPMKFTLQLHGPDRWYRHDYSESEHMNGLIRSVAAAQNARGFISITTMKLCVKERLGNAGLALTRVSRPRHAGLCGGNRVCRWLVDEIAEVPARLGRRISIRDHCRRAHVSVASVAPLILGATA